MTRSGFSLLELLIALALSSVIMLGLVQANRNAAHLLREAQSLLVVNRQVALLYNQLERDITSCVPYEKLVAYVPAKGAVKKTEGGEAPQEEPAKKEEKKPEKEVFVPSCTLEPFEEGAYRVGSKKWHQTKKISFITTTPLQIYDQQHERIVRVGYELVYDKKLSTPQKSVYTLYRLQTDQLENSVFTLDEQKRTKPVSRYVVANYIKQFSLEASYDPRPPEKKGENGTVQSDDEEKREQVKVFTWGEKEEKEKSKYMYPDHFSAHIEVWDSAINRSYSFVCMLPIFVKSLAKKREEKKEQPPEKKEQSPSDEAISTGVAHA